MRAHPRLGTVEVREIDVQSSLDDAAALAALVHALARAGARVAAGRAALPAEAIAESSFRASRDGLEATILHDGALRPVREVARAVVEQVAGHAREVGSPTRSRASSGSCARAAAPRASARRRGAAGCRSCWRSWCETPGGAMAELILGPLLRYVGDRSATVWVETDAPCEVEVLGQPRADVLRRSGHHYAHRLPIEGLEPGDAYPYEVALDGERAWPLAETRDFPPS